MKTFGRPMFVLLLLVMVLLATTELGTDSWISDIMRTVLGSPTLGTLFLVWTSFIMFVLRFFAGPIVHRITPLGLLAASAAIAAIGLLWLSKAGTSPAMLFAAATFYGLGKTFFWPTTLGVVSEQYPRGGALMLNAIAGVGMISVGTIGNPAIGAVQDRAMATRLRDADPVVAERVVETRRGLFGESPAVNPAKRATSPPRPRPTRATRRSSSRPRWSRPPISTPNRGRSARSRSCRSSCWSAISGSSSTSRRMAAIAPRISCQRHRPGDDTVER